MNKVKLFFIYNKQKKEIYANVGESLLDIAKHNDLPLEGACDGCLSCATCHVILDVDWYNDEKLKLNEKSEIEDDLLEYAFGLGKTSRLGCQIKVTEEMNGMIIYLPSDGRNFVLNGE